MRSRFRTAALSCLLALAAASCGTKATGITAAIEPDPVSAAALSGSALYSASWDVVVSDLTGQGGTVESIATTVSGTPVALDEAQGTSLGATSSQAALGAFDRRTFHQAGTFTVAAGASATMAVTAHFRAGDGTTHDATAEARITLR